MTPTVATTRGQLHDVLGTVRGSGRSVALVPTMGALHEGHRALVRTARAEADAVVVSIFVNPAQFGPGEDLERYPRDVDGDLAVCTEEHVDVVFAPSVEEIYPDADSAVTVDPGPVAGILEGVARPTHFRGVLTVVAKLFGLVQPQVAVFGEKDYQQLTLVRQMVRDLAMPLALVAMPTVREADGLALSTRNSYLDAGQRAVAPTLHAALQAGVAVGAGGATAVLEAARAVLAGAPELQLDYLALTSTELGPVEHGGEARLLAAVSLGATRLIDNVPLVLGDPGDRPAQPAAATGTG